jgi:hypothetical protein
MELLYKKIRHRKQEEEENTKIRKSHRYFFYTTSRLIELSSTSPGTSETSTFTLEQDERRNND